MRTKTALMLALVAATAVAAIAPILAQPQKEAAPIYGVTLPPGYREWRMVSVASVGAPVNDLRVKLGNDIAMQAYRSGKRPFPDGAIIARLAYRQTTSEENNKVIQAAA